MQKGNALAMASHGTTDAAQGGAAPLQQLRVASQPTPEPELEQNEEHRQKEELPVATCRHVKMALLLLEERRRGRKSPVWGYVEHLPRHFDTLLHWSEAELRELCYPALQQSVSH